MAQLILALDLMHRNRIIHRDIKPVNILLMDLKEMMICLSDLGMACMEDSVDEIFMMCGTPSYVAPEVLKGEPFTCKADIFSAGSFFYNLVAQTPLFKGNSV
jgi:serine/threonine protein kinase